MPGVGEWVLALASESQRRFGFGRRSRIDPQGVSPTRQPDGANGENPPRTGATGS